MNAAWNDLMEIRRLAGERTTEGLGENELLPVLERDADLRSAIGEALGEARRLAAIDPEGPAVAEDDLCADLQRDYLNFYGDSARSPHAPLAARGPWIVTLHGAVLHDSGGYGMLGLGHAPESVLEVLDRPWVMANVMTPSLSQRRSAERLRREIGRTRGGGARTIGSSASTAARNP